VSTTHKNLLSLTSALRIAGGRTYVVGGTVRDEILGYKPKDVDVLVTGLDPETLHRVVGYAEGVAYIDTVGKSFGVLKATFEEGEVIDIALPRVDLDADHVRVDLSVTVEEDLARRDFTMNALAYEVTDYPKRGSIIDPFHGQADIAARLIRAVGYPDDRFEEDKNRMMRAVRFVSKLGFDIAADTDRAIGRCAHMIVEVPGDRLGPEILKILNGWKVLKGLRKLRDTGLLEFIIPEYVPTMKFDQKNKHHRLTVDEHQFEAVVHAKHSGSSDRVLLALFLHDIAKPQTFTCGEDGCGHFYGHEAAGAPIVEKVLTRLRFSAADVEACTKMVREHLRPGFPEGGQPSDKTLRKWVADMGDLWPEALEHRVADAAAHVVPANIDPWAWGAEIRKRCEMLPKFLTGFSQKNLALNGEEMRAEFPQLEGKAIGGWKKLLAEAVIAGRLPNEKEALLNHMKTFADSVGSPHTTDTPS
jgi:tRNA nucleotidyltransferase/poly(A) polymerase